MMDVKEKYRGIQIRVPLGLEMVDIYKRGREALREEGDTNFEKKHANHKGNRYHS
jgi:hypothetical protein